MYTNKNIRWLTLFFCLLWFANLPLRSQQQGVGLEVGSRERVFEIKTCLDLEGIFRKSANEAYRSLDPSTYKDGFTGTVHQNGYMKVQIYLRSIMDWASERDEPDDLLARKDQLIYSVVANLEGNHNQSYDDYDFISYARSLSFHSGNDDINSGTSFPGNNIRKGLLALRSTYKVNCAGADQSFPMNYIISSPKFQDNEVLGDITNLRNYIKASRFVDNLTAVFTKSCNPAAGSGVRNWPVRIKITLRNANFQEFNHPLLSKGITYLNIDHPSEFENPHNFIDVDDYTGTLPLTEDMGVLCYEGATGRLICKLKWSGVTSKFEKEYYSNIMNTLRVPANDNKEQLETYLGDIIVFYVRQKEGNINPPTVNMGMPSVYISPFNSTMQFICNPDTRPSDPRPFVPWESQTHQKNLNAYPPGFVIRENDDWELSEPMMGHRYWLWKWVIQRNQDPGISKYRASIVFPTTKKYADGHIQRSEQSAGHQAEFLHYWKESVVTSNSGIPTYVPSRAGTPADRAAPKYTLTIDPDEILYSGSYRMYQKPVATGTTLLTAPTYPQVISPTRTKDLIAWQNMWPEEQTTCTYDANGYPAGGFLYNDYMSEYFKQIRPSPAYPRYDRYYKGHLIEDYDNYRKGSPSGTSVNPYRSDFSLPADTCGDNVWFNPSLGSANNREPCLVSISYEGKTYTPKIKAFSHIVEPGSNTFLPFYNIIQGTNNPLGWNTENTYEIPDLNGISKSVLASLTLKVMAYRPGGNMMDQHTQMPVQITKDEGGIRRRDRRAVIQQWQLSREIPVNNPYSVAAGEIDPYGGTPYTESEYRIKDLDQVQIDGKWRVKVHFQSGQSVLGLYYTNCIGEEVLLGGKNVMVQDPDMYQFAAPGSSSYPYSKTSLVGTGEIDLKEGEGEKVFEFLNDFRKSNDPRRGYIDGSESYPARRKFVKSYVLITGQKITFTTRNIGIGKTELFMSGGAWPWSGYYDMSRFMPQDSVDKYMKYTIYPMTDDYTLNLGSPIYTCNSKNLSYTWNTPGEYVIEMKFMNSPNVGYARVKVMDYDSDALNDLSVKKERGKIVVRKLTNQELKWLARFGGSGNDRIFTYNGGAVPTSTTLAIATVEDVPSLYKFNKGPRATLYGDRFGEFNDYNNEYVFYVHLKDGASGNSINPYYVKMKPIGTNDFTHQAIIDSIFPKSWKNIFLRHCSSNHDPDEDVTKSDVLTNVTQDNYKQAISNIYTTLNNQDELGYMRIFPWIAKTPTDGYKIFRFNKGVTDLETFFNGTGNFDGAWSGHPYKNIPYVQERMQMSSYPTLSDDDRDFLEFYNNLAYQRSIIYNTTYLDVDSVLNVNPKLAKADKSNPAEIYIARKEAGEPVEFYNTKANLLELFHNCYRVFEAARADNGLFREHYNPNSAASVTTTSPSANGMGLIALCIADRMKWDLNAQSRAERILSLLTKHLTVKVNAESSAKIKEWGTDVATFDKIREYQKNATFQMETCTGENKCPYHYLNIDTGAKIVANRDDDSNIPSTIDAAIMCYGALFARKYFSDSKVIDICAKKLFESIDWASMFADKNSIYHAFGPDGNPSSASAKSLPFNEYGIISYLAKNKWAFCGDDKYLFGNANVDLVNTYYENMTKALALDPSTLVMGPRSTDSDVNKFFRFKRFDSYFRTKDDPTAPFVQGKTLYALSDDRSIEDETINSPNHRIGSSFMSQFCYYLCHPLTTSPQFINYVRTAAAADYTDWRKNLGEDSYWGCGAGAGYNGSYSVQAPFSNTDKIASPHIVAGFLPVLENVPTENSIFKLPKREVLSIINRWCSEYENLNYKNKGMKYTVTSATGEPAVLWRASKLPSNLTWQPYDLQLLDFSTELFGLATVYMGSSKVNPTITGENFFEKYNDIFDLTVIPSEVIPEPGWWLWRSGDKPSSSNQPMPNGYVQAAPSTDVNEGTSTIVETTSKTGLSVYPIPNNGNFTVKMEDPSKVNPTGVYTIRVISMEGIVRYSGTTLGSNLLAGTPLYLTTTLKTGYYIVEVSGLGMRERKSFIVNN